MKFGDLTVVRYSHMAKRKSHWWCLCDCGHGQRAMFNQLTRGIITRCGVCRSIAIGNRFRTHGLTRSSTYASWNAMRTRTTNPKSIGWNTYGGAGIRNCEGFMSFDHFLKVMGERPNGLTLDRISTKNGYDCGKCDDCRSRGAELNCRWADFEMQANNKTNTVYIEYDGRRLTARGWSKITGLSPQLISSRRYSGWSTERILTTPVGFHWTHPK